MIGEGELAKSIKERVKRYNLEEKVVFLGTTNKVNELYNAMDCFVLPSRYEGLPVCGIEAQTNGLYCLFSSTITEELKNSEHVKFISIENLEEWKESILKIDSNNRSLSNEIINKYEIKKITNKIIRIINN